MSTVEGLVSGRSWTAVGLISGAHDSHGLNTGTPARSYSRLSRETTVIPWCSAVRRDKQIGLGERVSRLPALLDKETPREGHILADVEHPLGEQRPDL